MLTLMFDWFDAIGIDNEIDGLRSLFQGEGIYGWVKYSLPDGLWLFSYMFLVDAIWNGLYLLASQMPYFRFENAVLSHLTGKTLETKGRSMH